MNPQQVLGYVRLLPTTVNPASKGNCYWGPFPDVLPCVSACVFPARENRHRFSRWAEGIASPSPSIGIAVCGAYLTEDVMAVLCTLAVWFQGRVCMSLPPTPQLCSWVTYIWEKHRVSTLKCKKWPPRGNHSPAHGVSHPCFHAVTSGTWAR